MEKQSVFRKVLQNLFIGMGPLLGLMVVTVWVSKQQSTQEPGANDGTGRTLASREQSAVTLNKIKVSEWTEIDIHYPTQPKPGEVFSFVVVASESTGWKSEIEKGNAVAVVFGSDVGATQKNEVSKFLSSNPEKYRVKSGQIKIGL